ncbi:MAG TPA: nuclear transport factor 2 family protein [Caulobacteraceae bacterium]|nr:nuclear transport factor 2 family protein [Caulobacteraceae bacterium]
MAGEQDKALMEVEQRRCEAIGAADAEALGRLLTDDYVHIHASGLVENKEQVLASLAATRRTITRGDLNVRTYGDAAIIVGDQTIEVLTPGQERTIVLTSTQVAVRNDGAWRFVSFHSCHAPTKP